MTRYIVPDSEFTFNLRETGEHHYGYFSSLLLVINPLAFVERKVLIPFASALNASIRVLF